MVNYRCFRCGYDNNNRSVFRRHLTRTNKCKSILDDIDINDIFTHYFSKDSVNISANSAKKVPRNSEEYDKFTCKYCNKVFRHTGSRYIYK